MGEPQFVISEDGQEVGSDDINLIGQTAGLADDRVLAELLRMTPFDGTNVAKLILPTGTLPKEGVGGSTPVNAGTVQPSGNADGSILVLPFRAVVGSRTTVATSPIKNWRDIRSGIFVGPTALAQTFQLAANASGNARWDLVFATLSVDTPTGTLVKRVKSASDGSVSEQDLQTTLTQPVVVSVVQGTPGSSPTIPPLPGDAVGNYNIALAAVRVPAGFSATSTVATADIRDRVPSSALLSPTTGGLRACPGSGNNDQAGTYDADTAGPGAWSTTSGQRPGVFLPPGMVGAELRWLQVDLTVASHPSHADGSVLDDTIDWRKRFFVVITQYGTATFATVSSPATSSIPGPGFQTPSTPLFAIAASSGSFMSVGHSMAQDGSRTGTASTIMSVQPTGTPVYGVYVDQTNGALRWAQTAAAPAALRFWICVLASGPMPNN